MANYALNFLQATNWDPQAFGPAIEPWMQGRKYRTVAPKQFTLLTTTVPGTNAPTMPVDNTIQGAKRGDTRYKWYPYWTKAVVIGQPAVTATASPGFTNSWDWKFGRVNTPIAPITRSNMFLPVAPVPTIGM